MGTRISAVVVVALMACGGGTDGEGFVGVWEGTKTYLDQGGEPVATAPGWTFEIVPDGLTTVRFVNGPSASVTSGTELTIGTIDYPPRATPGPEGHCAPTTQSITGGTGTLRGGGILRVELSWTDSCGGVTTARRALFDMTRASPRNDVGSLL